MKFVICLIFGGPNPSTDFHRKCFKRRG